VSGPAAPGPRLLPCRICGREPITTSGYVGCWGSGGATDHELKFRHWGEGYSLAEAEQQWNDANRRAAPPREQLAHALYEVAHRRGFTPTIQQCELDADAVLAVLASGRAGEDGR